MNHQSQLDKTTALSVALSNYHTKRSIFLHRPHVPFIEYGLSEYHQIWFLTTGAPCGLAARC